MAAHSTTHNETLSRVARIEGQVRAVRRMIEDGQYCIDIINQVQAARAALQSLSNQILEKHLTHCVSNALNSRDEGEIDQKLDEIMKLIKRMQK
ncbi:MAG TPA: metal-sensitive transcriptional regulator [Pontiella sp.]